MKKIIYLMLIFVFSSFVLAEDKKLDFNHKKNQQNIKLQSDNLQLNEYDRQNFYFKVGVSPLLQHIGIGTRSHDESMPTGDDLSLNLYCPLTVAMVERELFFVMPSLKYTFLNYKAEQQFSKYWGVGVELGVFLNENATVPVPNIELVWGREKEHLSFSQFGVNLLPCAGFVTGFSLYVSKHGKGGFISNRDVGSVLMIVSSMSIVSYTMGF